MMAVAPELLKDINTAPDTGSSSPREFVEVGGTTYFVAAATRTVWKTDGTSEGTSPVLDSRVYDGVYGATDGPLIERNGKFYFSAWSEEHGKALWVSDGTSAGTHFAVAPSNASGFGVENLINVGGTLYFTTAVSDLGAELWKWDGVSSEPELVKDIVPGSGSPSITDLTNVNGELYFIASPFERRHEYLMKTDGTADGTVVLADVDAVFTGDTGDLTNLNGRLIFAGPGGVWTSDGTPEGTIRIAEVSGVAKGLAAVGDEVYFWATGNGAIWHSDGTVGGSGQIRSYGSSVFIAEDNIAGIEGTAYFFSPQSVPQLFRIDPTTFQPVLVSSRPPSYSHLVDFGDHLYFFSRDNLGPMLWKSDGTDVGTNQVLRFRETTDPNANAEQLFVGSQQLFMSANDALHGYELWASDGTTAGSGLVKDLINDSMGSPFTTPVTVGDTLYFAGDDGVHGPELWKSDGTAAGTQMVTDYSHAQYGVGPSYLANLNGLLVFQEDGRILRSDGTPEGTFKLADSGGNPRVTGDLLYFLADPNGGFAQGRELWRSDGTLAGTFMLKDIRAGGAPSYVTNRVLLNGKVYFPANDGSGFQIWETDGTTAGTIKVSQIPASAETFQLAVFDGALYFARQTAGTTQLWKSDGTAAGTTLLQTLGPAGEFALTLPRYMASDGHLFLMFSTAQDVHSNADNGYELWVINNDHNGADRLAVLPGLPTSTGWPPEPTPDFLSPLSDSVLFTAYKSEQGLELWTSDGTVAGTHIVKDILAGTRGSEPSNATLAGDQVYFAAHGPAGVELWRTDGTSEGTREAYDFRFGDSYPMAGKILGGSLYLSVNADRYGREIWRVDLNDAPQLNVTGEATFVENDAFVSVGAALDVSDVDNSFFPRGSLSIEISENASPTDELFLRGHGEGATELQISGSDVLFGGVIIGSWTAGEERQSLGITLNGAANLASVDAILDAVAFSALGDAPSPLDRTVSFTFNDGDGPTSATANLILHVQPVNDAPQLDIASSPVLDTFPEDTANPAGTLVSDLLGGAMTDPDEGAQRGIAITATSNKANGVWQYQLSGETTWRGMGVPLPSAALLLPETARVRFVPKLNFNGQVKLWHHAWDQTEGGGGGRLAEEGNQGGTKSLSLNLENATLTISPVNDAPQLNTSPDPALNTIPEDANKLAGTLVSDLLGTAVADPDANAKQGIAVIAPTTTSNGTWQYRLPGQATWSDMGAPQPSAALLLPAAAKVRFMPNPNFNGQARLWYRAWDQTAGTSGGTLEDTGNQGGSASLSWNVVSATVTVAAVNDAPVLNPSLNPVLNRMLEDDTNPFGTLVGNFASSAIVDPDPDALKGIAVTAAGTAKGQWQYSLDNGTTWTEMNAAGLVSESSALLLPVQAGSRVRFIPNHNFNGVAQLWYAAWDQTAGTIEGRMSLADNRGGAKALSWQVEHADLTVTPVNDAPLLTLSGNVGYAVNSPTPVILAPNALVQDVDNPDFESGELRIKISTGADASNRLVIGGAFTVVGSNVKLGDATIGTLNANGGVGMTDLVVTLTADAKKMVVRDLIRAIGFKTVGGLTGDRTVLFSLSDGDGSQSEELPKTIRVR